MFTAIHFYQILKGNLFKNMRSSSRLLGYRVPQFPPISESSSPLIFQKFFRGFCHSISDAFAANHDTAVADSLYEQSGVPLNRKLVVGTLKSLYTNPEAAYKFFNWISSQESQRLSSKEYNLMLRILGSNGLASEFWDLVSVMKDKGCVIATGDRRGKVEMSNRIDADFVKSMLKSSESSNKVSMLIRSKTWGEELEEEVRGIGLELSSDYLKNILESLAMEPAKAMMFFRWTEEMVKHDSVTYNAIARVLIREDYIEKFWKILNEMNSNALKIEFQTYVKAANHFLRKQQYREAVDITSLAMEINLSHSTFTHLLKKISSAKEFDVELFTRVVNLMKENGIPISNSTVASVLKSLVSAKRMSESGKIIKIMREKGLVLDGSLQIEIAQYLTKHHGGEAEAMREAIAGGVEGKAMVEAYCKAGKLREARESFRVMVGGMEGENERDAFHCLIEACGGKNGRSGFELLKDVPVKPWRKSYVAVIDRLMKEGAYREAVEVVGMMRMSGYQPSIGRLMEYLKKAGTVDDAAALMAVASPKIGAEIFRGYFDSGRYEEARVFFRKCGGSFRTDPAVLSMLADTMSTSH